MFVLLTLSLSLLYIGQPTQEQQQQQEASDGQATQDGANQKAAGESDEKSGRKADDHGLDVVRAELEELRRRQQEKDRALAELQKKNQALEHTLNVFSESTQTTMGTGDANELARMAKERRMEQAKEAVRQAVDMIPTLEEWWQEAPGEVRNDLGADFQKIKNFATADKEIVNDPEKMKSVIKMTKVFHTFKNHADKRVTAERERAESVTKALGETQTKLRSEQDKHAKTTAKLQNLERQIALLRQATGQTNATSDALTAPPVMRSGGYTQSLGGMGAGTPNQMLHTMASSKPAPSSGGAGIFSSQMSGASTTSDSSAVDGVLSKNHLGQPGEKRTATQAQLDIKHTQASATASSTATSGFERNTRPRLAYESKIPVQGCFGLFGNRGSTKSRPIPGMLQNLMSGIKTDLQTNGLSSSILRGVEIDRPTQY